MTLFSTSVPRSPLPRSLTAGLLVGVSLGAAVLHAQDQDFSKVEIETMDLGDGIYMMSGEGGNLGVSVGEDGVFLIDDQYAPLSEKIMAALGELSDQPVNYLLNTHWHFDHTGGNENFGKSGAVIVAHDNVRKRMSTDQFIEAFQADIPASPEIALPVVTFTNDVTFYFNGREIDVMHRPAAHTDGDSVVRFADVNIMHLGDTFFNGIYPFIDGSSGGSLDGVILAIESVLPLVDENTKIIPGHGPLADKADLESYLEMLVQVRDLVRPMAGQGISREDVLAANPLQPLEAQWGGGFLDTATFTGLVYDME